MDNNSDTAAAALDADVNDDARMATTMATLTTNTHTATNQHFRIDGTASASAATLGDMDDAGVGLQGENFVRLAGVAGGDGRLDAQAIATATSSPTAGMMVAVAHTTTTGSPDSVTAPSLEATAATAAASVTTNATIAAPASPLPSSFFAVRKGVGLTSPAIFFSWDDAKAFVGKEGEATNNTDTANGNSNSNGVDFKAFSTIDQAVQYLTGCTNMTASNTTNDATDKKRKIPATTTTAGTATTTATKKRRRKATSTTFVNMIKQSEFDKMMVQLQQFKDQYHHVKVPGPFSKLVKVDAKYTPLRAWMAMVRQAVKQYQEDRRYCPLTDPQMVQLVDIGFIPRSTIASTAASSATAKDDASSVSSSVTGHGGGDSNRWKTPTSAHNLLKLKKELEDTWDDRILLLQEYKLDKGHCNVPKRPNKSLEEKYVPLCKFAGWMQKFLSEYHESKDKTHFFLTPQRIQRLQELGFHCTTPSTRVNARDVGELDFDDMLVEMKRIKETNVPIKTNRKLEWWIAEQRKQYALFKANKPSTITAEKIAAMAEAGFPFEKAKAPTWDERAVEWLEFKTKMGRDPMREESLYQWVYKQRVKYKQKQEGKKNNLTDEQIKRLTEWGFNWEMRFQFPHMSKPASWEERFEELVKFKEANGTCQVHKTVPVLGQWVKQQRKEYRYYVQGSKPSRMTQERIVKLSSIGFDFGEQRWNTGKMKEAHAAVEKGKAQESVAAAASMQAGDGMLQHLTIPGLADNGNSGEIMAEPNAQQLQQSLMDQQRNSAFRHAQQTIPVWDRFRNPFNI